MLSCSPSSEKSEGAAIELLRRRKARTSLLDFTRFTFQAYNPEPAHALLSETLDRVVSGELQRLIICAPPQHGKSELASVRLPAYWLGRRPDDPVIVASYAASLAESKSRQARQLVEAVEYRRLFPDIATRQDSRSVSHWHLHGHRGYLLAAGVGGPITGHGARLGIIDDPVENWQEAQSEIVRETCWEWYRSTFRTRIWEGGAIVLIQTRWHTDDLAGRLLQDQGNEWEVLRLPAISETQDERDESNRLLGLPAGESDPLDREPGAPLCPGRYSLEALQSLKRDVGSLSWHALYQGVPRAPEGNRFKRSWFKFVEFAPYKASRVRYWDRAATEGGGDHTVGVLMAFADGTYYVEDMVRGQWSSGARDNVIRETAEGDSARYNHSVQTWVEQEPGSSGKDAALAAVRLLAGFSIRADKVTGSKEVRADPLAAQAEAGNVCLVRGPWNGAYLDELCAFPNGTHDDAVDASSGAFAQLANVRQAGTLYTMTPGKKHGLRLAFCSPQQLATTLIEEPCLLLVAQDPPTEPGILGKPPHALARLVDWLPLPFLDLDPEVLKERWVKPYPPYADHPEKLILTRDLGKRFWAFLTKRREPPVQTVVFVGDDRALTLALAAAKNFNLKPKDVDMIGSVNHTPTDPPCKRLFELVRSYRGTVA